MTPSTILLIAAASAALRPGLGGVSWTDGFTFRASGGFGVAGVWLA